MDETAPEAAARLLEGVRRLEELPIAALSRALAAWVRWMLKILKVVAKLNKITEARAAATRIPTIFLILLRIRASILS